LSNNALECSIAIRAASAIKLAELAAARKNHGLTKKLQQRHLPNWPLRAKNRALAQTRQTWFGNDQAVQ
jgi:hypothetical protein